MDIGEEVYATLLNTVRPEFQLPWVTPVFVPDHPCYESYRNMHAAYERLLQRLNVQDEDVDAEEMIDCLLQHGKLLALEMFQYGIIYQKRMDAEKPDT